MNNLGSSHRAAGVLGSVKVAKFALLSNFVASAVGISAGAVAGQGNTVTSTWVGPVIGEWTSSVNWFPPIVPNNSGEIGFDVILGGPSEVGLGDEVSVDKLTLGSQGLLEIPNGRSLRIDAGPLFNDGTIWLKSTGTFTELRLNAPEVRLEGLGTLNLSLNGNNRVVGVGTPRRLVNTVNHTITGGGHLGADTLLRLSNDGEIVAGGGGQPLRIDLVGTDNQNRGSIRTFSAPLIVIDTVLDNDEGEIAAANLWTATIIGSSITGGMVRADPGSETLLAPPTSTFRDVTFDGTLRQPTSVDAAIRGTIVNDGEWLVQAGLGVCTLIVDEPSATLGGNGTIILSASANNRLVGTGGVRHLVHLDGHTIRGSGAIGHGSTLTLDNHGVIEALSSTPPLTLTLSGSMANNRNLGSIGAAPGGRLVIQGSGIDNTGGEIGAKSGGVVELSGSPIKGGTIRSELGGEVRLVGNPSTFTDVQLDGSMRSSNNVDAFVMGSMINDGTWLLDSTGGLTDIIVLSEILLLSGSGEIVMSTSAGNRVIGLGGTRRLINDAGHTIRGSGQIGANLGLDLTNLGVIVAEGSAGLAIDVVSEFVNMGTLRAAPNSTLTIATGELLQSGTLDIAGGGKIVRQGPLTLAPSAALRVTLRRSDLGNVPLSASGAATLGGTLEVLLDPSDPPLPGDTFTIVSAPSIAGAPDMIVGCVPLDVEIATSGLTITILKGAGAGGGGADLNGNGFVDGIDLGALLAAWGACVDPCCPADLNGDGTVDALDLGMLLVSWNG